MLALVALVLVVLTTLAGPFVGMMGYGGYGGYGPMMGGYGYRGPSPLWGLGVLLVALVALAVTGYLLYRGFGRRPTGGPSDPALAELRLAYARGDLTSEEFEERRERLRRPPEDE